MRRLLLCTVGAVLFTACSSGGGGAPAAPVTASTTSTAAHVSTTSTLPTEPALWTDEPCTRAAAATDALPAAVGYRLDDLEHMVLSRDDVGGLRGFESDMTRHGFWGNGELQSMEVNPPSTCDDMQKFGRIIGFANAYDKQTRPARLVTFSVHLFHDEAGARGWVQAFTSALKASAGTKDGPTTFDVRPFGDLGPDAVLAEHGGRDGNRTWVMFVRGPIVGWVTDLNHNIDVGAAAKAMATRIETVAKSDVGPDAARLMSIPLPLSAYGPRYAGLKWDWFFGGCADTEERGYVVGEETAKKFAAMGRVAGCTAMYDPQQDTGSSIVRVFSQVNVFRDDKGASAAVADKASQVSANGEQRFDVTVGDEAVASVAPPRGEQDFTTTGVTFRIGNLEIVVAIHDKDPRDTRPEVTRLAGELAQRVQRLST